MIKTILLSVFLIFATVGIVTAQEQLGPPPSGGGSQPAPFSSSVLQKFLPSYSW